MKRARGRPKSATNNTNKKQKIDKNIELEDKLVEKVLALAGGYKEAIKDHVRIANQRNSTGRYKGEPFLAKYLQLQEYVNTHGSITGFVTKKNSLAQWYYNQKKLMVGTNTPARMLARKILFEACTGRKITSDNLFMRANDVSWTKNFDAYENHLKTNTRVEDKKLHMYVLQLFYFYIFLFNYFFFFFFYLYFLIFLFTQFFLTGGCTTKIIFLKLVLCLKPDKCFGNH